jgi:FkbM family methyltransferase
MRNETAVTFKNTVIKTQNTLLQKAGSAIKNDGIDKFIVKTVKFLFRCGFLFFREYVPLKFLSYLSNKGEIIKDIQGNNMILSLKDFGISRELALHGFHEKSSTEQIKKMLKSGMKIVEVGANIGYYTLIEAKLIGKDGFIYAFEPSPRNFEFLKRNIILNKYKNIEIYQKAIGSENGTSKFFVANRSNLSSLIKREDWAGLYNDNNGIDVEVIKLDEFLKDKKVDLIRMDIEGYELEVLKGLRYTLNSYNAPQYFFIEVHSELLYKQGYSAGEIIKYLENFGYSVTKSFYRGSSEVSVNNTRDLLSHPYLEKGYWETFFALLKK